MNYYDIILAKKLSGGGGGGSATLIDKNISANGTYNASSDSADGYKKVVVSVPNTYVAGDEGKVVSNGALVSQSSETYTENGTYDTTLKNSITVDVQGGTPSPLPSGYTQMKYLESSGTQYIDTGLYTKANQKYYIDFVQSDTSSENIFGNNLSSGCGVFFQTSSANMYYRFGSANYTTTNLMGAQNTGYAKKFMIAIDGLYSGDAYGNPYVKFVSISSSSVTEDSSIHNILFGRTTGATTRQLSKVRIYHFKCEEGNDVVRDMYPAMDSNNVLGMYDVINDHFYTNDGTGTFTGGSL